MFSGFRAVYNRLCSNLYTDSHVQFKLHGTNLHTQGMGEVKIHVHSRQGPGAFRYEADFGMVSIQQLHPKISSMLYKYFCLTSHFGCGHFEIAFYERNGEVTLYAIRNTACSNACRIGFTLVGEELALPARDEDAMLLLVQLLERNGFTVNFADSSECVKLSVTSRLLNHDSKSHTMDILRKRYDRLKGIFESRVASQTNVTGA